VHFGPTSNGTACMCCTILVLPVHMRDVRYDAELATVYKNGAAEVRFVNGGAYMKISTHQVSSHLALCINGHRAPLTPAHIHALALAEESKKRHDAAGSQGDRDGFKATLSIVGKPIGEHTIFQALDATLVVYRGTGPKRSLHFKETYPLTEAFTLSGSRTTDHFLVQRHHRRVHHM
jgi:hypothetical protein